MRCILFSAAVIAGAVWGSSPWRPIWLPRDRSAQISGPPRFRRSAGVASTGATAIPYHTPIILPLMGTTRRRRRTPTIHPLMTPMCLRLPSRMATIHQRMATTATIRPRMASMVSIRPRMPTDRHGTAWARRWIISDLRRRHRLPASLRDVQTLRKVRDAPDREALFHIMDGMSACGT